MLKAIIDSIFDVLINNDNITLDNIVKVAGNRYKLYFTYLTPQTDVSFEVTGYYGTGIETNTYVIEPITITQTILTFSATIKNSEYPDWWSVSLTGSSSRDISVETEESGNAAGLQFNVNYTSPFKAYIKEVTLKLNGVEYTYPIDNDTGSGSFTSIRNFSSLEFPDGEVTMSMRIKDDMGMYSNWSNEKTFNSLKIATYTPTVNSVKIKDYRDQTNNSRKRGPLTVELLIDDFFAIFRNPSTGSFNVTNAGTPVPDTFTVTEIKKINNKQQKITGTIDSTNWLTIKGETKTFNYSTNASYTYPSGKLSETKTGTFNVSTYNPHVIKKIEYTPNRLGEGIYSITYDKSPDSSKFNIEKVHLTVKKVNADGSTEEVAEVYDATQFTIEPHPTSANKMIVKVVGPQLVPHELVPVSAYFEHTDLTENSAVHSENIIIYKPHTITFKDGTSTAYHRTVNKEIDGYSKRFAGQTLVSPETAPESVLFDFTLYYKDKDGLTKPYKEFSKVYISPRGAVVFTDKDTNLSASDIRDRIPTTNTNVVSEDFGYELKYI